MENKFHFYGIKFMKYVIIKIENKCYYVNGLLNGEIFWIL